MAKIKGANGGWLQKIRRRTKKPLTLRKARDSNFLPLGRGISQIMVVVVAVVGVVNDNRYR